MNDIPVIDDDNDESKDESKDETKEEIKNTDRTNDDDDDMVIVGDDDETKDDVGDDDDFDKINDDDLKEPKKQIDHLTRILPPAKSNVGKKHDVHFTGLLAAVSSNKCQDIVLHKIIKSPSIMFKQFLIVNYIKQETQNSKLIDLVIKSVPFVQRYAVKCLLQNSRNDILDALVMDCYKKFGCHFVARFVHGLSLVYIISYILLYLTIYHIN